MVETHHLDHAHFVIPARPTPPRLDPSVPVVWLCGGLGLLVAPLLGLVPGVAAWLGLASLCLGVIAQIAATEEGSSPPVELWVYPTRIDVKHGRKRCSVQPGQDRFLISSDLIAQQTTLKAAAISAPVRLSVEEEKRLWRTIDAATKSARSRAGLGAREVPAALKERL